MWSIAFKLGGGLASTTTSRKYPTFDLSNNNTDLMFSAVNNESKCITTGGGNNRGNRMTMYDCSSSDPNDLFRIEGLNIRSSGSATSQCWSVSDGRNHPVNERPMTLWDCDQNDPNQQFSIQEDNTILWTGNPNPNARKCVNSDGKGNASNGNNMSIYDCDATDDTQLFNSVYVNAHCCLDNSQSDNSVNAVNGIQCSNKNMTAKSPTCAPIVDKYCSNNNITSPFCKNLENTNKDIFDRKMKDYCNMDANSQSTDCINWCGSHMTDCVTLNNKKDCITFGLSNTCSPSDVLNMKTKCIESGMLSQQGFPIGDFKCSADGIAKLNAKCVLYHLTGGECTSNKVQNKETDEANIAAARVIADQNKLNNDKALRQQTIDNAAALKQSADQFSITKATLSKVIDVSNFTSTDNTDNTYKNKKDKQNTYIIIFIIIMIIMLLSSSSSIGLFIMNQE